MLLLLNLVTMVHVHHPVQLACICIWHHGHNFKCIVSAKILVVIFFLELWRFVWDRAEGPLCFERDAEIGFARWHRYAYMCLVSGR